MSVYAHHFRHLHTAANRTTWTAATDFRAPHKMLLLLSVIDLVEEGSIQRSFVELTPALLEQFAGYWSSIMPPGHRGDIFKPFFHLKSEGFWELVAKPGREAIVAALRSPHGMRDITDNVLGAKLDDALFAEMRDPSDRQLLREALLSYFDDNLRERLAKRMRLSRRAFDYSRLLLDEAHGLQVAEVAAPAEETVRDQGFRRAVVTAYVHRCAFCGVRMLTADGHTAVDAAHIVPWSESRNDDVRNGLALCKLCHWAFDELLVSVSSRYTVLTSPQLDGNDNIAGPVGQLKDRYLLLPVDVALGPAQQYLHDHRQRFAGV